MTLRDYYHWYRTQHRVAANRRLHAFGSLLVPFVALAFAFGAVLASPWALLPMPFALFFCSYGPAWVGHWFIEGNRPATFTDPVRSLICDYWMLWDEIQGGDCW